jgi:hypothetical protein
LAILLPNPLPSSYPSSLASKYPFAFLRKSLRLLIDDNPEALGEVENDVSFVYSGYAPISVRLVQCIAQKGGVISNPADKERPGTDTGYSDGQKVQAHPILGWKGFEDVIAAIPGQTFEISQMAAKTPAIGLATNLGMFRHKGIFSFVIRDSRFCERNGDNYGCIFPGWLYVH